MTVWLTTLPRLACFVDGRELSALPNQRLRAGLLAYMAVERESTRDHLLQLLYPDRSTDRGRRALTQMIYEIRQDLGEEWLEGSADRLCVLPTVRSDAATVIGAVERRAWSEALEMYGGRFLDGVYLVETNAYQDWLDDKRRTLAKLHWSASRARIREQIGQRDYAGALQTAQAWARIDPHEEEAHQRVIELFGLTGRPAEAQRQYDDYAKLLEREGLTPLEETREVLKKARAQNSVWPSPERMTEAPPPGREAGEFNELLPELQVMHLLETGSVARVYVAREVALNRLVAIKMLAPQLATDESARARFELEVQSAARIQHPNVATVHRSGRLRSGIPYFVMPYFDGGTLEQRLRAAGAFDVEEARAIIGQLASALAAAHRLGIIHRDVRPANILYDRMTQRVLLTDFGIAAVMDTGSFALQRITRPDERLGNPAYVSPEQLEGRPVNERTDVYSLGVVAFEMLTGRLPFDARNVAEQVTATASGRVRKVSEFRPEVPAALAELVQRCLATRFEHRPFAADVARMVR